MFAGPALGAASQLGVKIGAYRADAPAGWGLAGASPHRSLQNLGTRSRPARGWALYRFAHEARAGGWEVVFIREGVRAEEAAKKIKALLTKPVPPCEVGRLSWWWLLRSKINKERW